MRPETCVRLGAFTLALSRLGPYVRTSFPTGLHGSSGDFLYNAPPTLPSSLPFPELRVVGYHMGNGGKETGGARKPKCMFSVSCQPAV